MSALETFLREVSDADWIEATKALEERYAVVAWERHWKRERATRSRARIGCRRPRNENGVEYVRVVERGVD